MIDDGYTKVIHLSGPVFYRPMTAAQREHVWWMADAMDEDASEAFIEEAIRMQIVHGDVQDVNTVRFAVFGDPEEEERDEENLREGVKVVHKYPWLKNVTCSQCRVWWFNPLDGTCATRDGQQLRRCGKVLCETNDSCPKGHWKSPIEFSEKNQRAYDHYLECKATGRFPNDPIVLRNARIIEEAIRAAR